MKRIVLTFALFVFSLAAFSQITEENFQKAEVVWYGLDFSKAKLIGSEGFENPELIRNDFFEKWNVIIINEADKYDLKGAFRKSDLKFDLEMIEDFNRDVAFQELVVNKSYTITKDDVSAAVKKYKTDQKSGYGIVFVVESFDKISEKAAVWVTIFDASNKKVLIAEKMEAEPSGFGLRNYWSGAIYEIIKDIKEIKYKSWFR